MGRRNDEISLAALIVAANQKFISRMPRRDPSALPLEKGTERQMKEIVDAIRVYAIVPGIESIFPPANRKNLSAMFSRKGRVACLQSEALQCRCLGQN